MRFKYIYGPVSSWRFGSSLGIDLLSQADKVCSFDCLYCQLGKTKALTTKRKLYVPTKKVVEEVKALPKVPIDYITFSGRGEPTLAKNLGQAIKAVKKLRKEPVVVLTNSSLVHRKDVREELALADVVAFKLDADSQKSFKLINRPTKTIKFSHILKGIKQFRKSYRGKLVLQIMLLAQNKAIIKNIVELAEEIAPDEVQLCTSRRPSPVRALPRKTVLEMQRYFRKIKAISFYTTRYKKVRPIDKQNTILRRGSFE